MITESWTYASQYGFTVEPGIYIPAEGFGIRLEDDLVIQERRTIQPNAQHSYWRDEIESLMN
jgi:Xaa-Pro aminopeptidase